MKPKEALTALLVLALLSSNSLLASAGTFELGYDDGKFDYGWSDFHPLAAAVRFSPPSTDWIIDEVGFYGVCLLTRYPTGSFYVQICDQNLNLMYQDSFPFSSFFSGKNATLGWYTVKVSKVLVRGDFYVVVVPRFTLDGPQLWIGVDVDRPISNMSFTVDSTRHIVTRSWDAASEKPKNFMIRAIGEPTAAPPELKLTSIDTDEGGTTVRFSVLRANVEEVRAKLFVAPDRIEECKVSRTDNSSFSVIAGWQGSLSVYVSTDKGPITTSVDIGGKLRPSYQELLIKYWKLGNESAEISRDLEKLSSENSLLKIQLNQSMDLIWLLDYRIEKLTQNVTSLKQNVDSLNETILTLRNENAWLLIGLSVAVLAAIAGVAAIWLGVVEVRRIWKK